MVACRALFKSHLCLCHPLQLGGMLITTMQYHEKCLSVVTLFAAASVILFYVIKRMPLGAARVLATLPIAAAMMALPFIFDLESELLSRGTVGVARYKLPAALRSTPSPTICACHTCTHTT